MDLSLDSLREELQRVKEENSRLEKENQQLQWTLETEGHPVGAQRTRLSSRTNSSEIQQYVMSSSTSASGNRSRVGTFTSVESDEMVTNLSPLSQNLGAPDSVDAYSGAMANNNAKYRLGHSRYSSGSVSSRRISAGSSRSSRRLSSTGSGGGRRRVSGGGGGGDDGDDEDDDGSDADYSDADTSSTAHLSNVTIVLEAPATSVNSPASISRPLDKEVGLNSNFIEMGVYGVDRDVLSGHEQPKLARRQVGTCLDHYPAGTASAVEQLVDFCFPEGVLFDLTTAAEALKRTGAKRDRYHLVQFSDANAVTLYGCCLVVTEAMPAPNSTVVENLRHVLFMRRCARRVQRFLQSVLVWKISNPDVYRATRAAMEVRAQSLKSKPTTDIRRHGLNTPFGKAPKTPLTGQPRMGPDGAVMTPDIRTSMFSRFRNSISRSFRKDAPLVDSVASPPAGLGTIEDVAHPEGLEIISPVASASAVHSDGEGESSSPTLALDYTKNKVSNHSLTPVLSSSSNISTASGTSGASGLSVSRGVTSPMTTSTFTATSRNYREFVAALAREDEAEAAEVAASSNGKGAQGTREGEDLHRAMYKADEEEARAEAVASGVTDSAKQRMSSKDATDRNDNKSAMDDDDANSGIADLHKTVIVTQRSFVLLTRKTNHAELFEILRVVANKERMTVEATGDVGQKGGADYVVSPAREPAVAALRDRLVCDLPFMCRMSRRHRFLQHCRLLKLSAASPSSSTSTSSASSSPGKHASKSKAKNKPSHLATLKAKAVNASFPLYAPKFSIPRNFPPLEEALDCLLFSLCPSPVLVKIQHLVLLEQSIVICGLDAGLVSGVAMAVASLIKPFKWEGIMIPLLPPSTREVFEAPVPFIVGVASTEKWLLPHLEDIPSTVSVLSLRYEGDNSGENTYQGGANQRCGNLYAQLEQLGDSQASPHIDSGLLVDVVGIERELASLLRVKPPRMRLEWFLAPPADPQVAAMFSVARRMKRRIVRHNELLQGDITARSDSWNKYGAVNHRTGFFEFYPDLFIEPKRALVEFQEQISHTQLFVSHVESTRSAYLDMQDARELISFRLWFLFRRRQGSS